MNDGIVTGDCSVLYCAALRRTQVVDECNAFACSFVVTSDSYSESSYFSPRSRTTSPEYTPLTPSPSISLHHSPFWVNLKFETHYTIT